MGRPKAQAGIHCEEDSEGDAAGLEDGERLGAVQWGEEWARWCVCVAINHLVAEHKLPCKYLQPVGP